MPRLRLTLILMLSAASVSLAPRALCETGGRAWLRYIPIRNGKLLRQYRSLPSRIVTLDNSSVIRTAENELSDGLHAMLGRPRVVQDRLGREPAIILGTLNRIRRAAITRVPDMPDDAYLLKRVRHNGSTSLLITAANDRGVLYGVFSLLRKIALHEPLPSMDQQRSPYASIRMLDHWDNLDGSIERGYAGPSIFFENNNVAADLRRVREYARLMASIGINSCSINNVNADARVITTEFLPQLTRIAEAVRPWGVKLFASIDFSSPQKLGKLQTFDPLDATVAAWWDTKVDEIYRAIPDFGGFVLKADSEGRLGPSAYGRTHADAANVIARALKPHGGLIFYRGFVYDHHMDWRNLKNDRARAAFDNLQPLDGRFDDNVVLQIKHGPIDFQVREPASPLFGALEHTNQAIELQITQEYTGQQRHLCFLIPMWKEVLDFDMHANASATPVKKLVAGKTFERPIGGFVAVSNVGRDENWLGHHLAMANLYGFGRLAWNPDLSSEKIADEWTRLTFGDRPEVVSKIVRMQLGSWSSYEKYTGPLGAGTLTDIINVHYGPAIESSERNGWGQWHRADKQGIGMDRTTATGTGYIGQYRKPVAEMYESLESCPDELLLFMHHVPYTHVLHSGKTVIQHIYDSHYEGAAEAERLVREWQSLEGRVDRQRYEEVLSRLEYQAGHARVWRDAVCNWFHRISGIPDRLGRVGNHPYRTEAESMQLRGYAVEPVTPWEAGSGGDAVKCAENATGCSAAFRYRSARGTYDVAVQYFDQNNGSARFKLFAGTRLLSEWTADDNLPSDKVDGHSSTRHIVKNIPLAHNEEIRIEGKPDRGEVAAIDYIEVRPARRDRH